MSANKKPRKKYNPNKRASMDAFAGLRALQMARALQSDRPLDKDQLLDLGISYHGALSAVVSGSGTHDDTNVLAMASNICMLLCESGIGKEHIDIARAGQEAIVILMMRHLSIGKCIATGQELKALQELLELHDAQLASEECTEARMTAVLAECKRRIKAQQVLRVAA